MLCRPVASYNTLTGCTPKGRVPSEIIMCTFTLTVLQNPILKHRTSSVALAEKQQRGKVCCAYAHFRINIVLWYVMLYHIISYYIIYHTYYSILQSSYNLLQCSVLYHVMQYNMLYYTIICYNSILCNACRAHAHLRRTQTNKI